MKCIPPASIFCYCSCFSCVALHGFTPHCIQQIYTILQRWCTPPPLSMQCLEIASDAPAGIFQAQNAFQMPPRLLFSLFMSFLWPKALRAAFLISYIYFGWGEVDFIQIHLDINQKNMSVGQSTLLLEIHIPHICHFWSTGHRII